MSFNDGFSTQGIPYITGSDGQVLTWSDTLQQWISADPSGGGGGSFTGVHLDPTNSNLEGVGILSSPLKVSDNINLSSVTASFSGDGSQLTNLPLSNYATKTNVTGAISDALIPYATTSSVTGAISSFPTRAEVTGTLNDYATLTGVSASFTTPVQVSGAITGALTPYATLSGVSASFARIDIDNNFVGNQSVTGYVSASVGLTGSAFGITAQFTDITASSVSSSDVITNYINFRHSTDPAWDNGRLWYNNATHELNYWTEVGPTNPFNVKLGQQLVQRCQNDQGTLLTKGSIVHITGSTSSDTPRIILADWTNDNLSANTLGLVAEDIAIGGTGYVIVQGILKGIDTNSYSPGQILFLSSSGQITATKPTAPKHTVSIGQVIRKQSPNGSIYVSIQNGYELGELHDVSTNGKSNNDLLIWDSTVPAWKNSNTLGGYTFSGVNTFQNSITGSSAYFSGDVRINGTASISHLDTIEQNTLKIGDKYITILSGGNTHVELDGAGLLYGSGSTDGTTGDEQSVAYVLYRNAYDKVEIFPGLRVSGSITASAGVSGSFIGDGSELVNIPSTAVNLSNYATLTGVSGTFVSQSQLSSYATNSGVTASFAALNSANTFNANQTVTGSIYVTSTVSASQISGSFSGSGAGLYDIPASSISLTGYAKLDTSNIFTANQTISGSLFVSSSLSTLDGLTASNITSSNTLQVGGQSTFAGGVKLPISTKNSNYTLTASSDYIIAFSGSNLTGTLPSSSGIGGSTLVIKNLHTSSLFITASAGTIDGSTTGLTIYNQYSSYTFISDNTNWLII